jgi:acyl dehydratase
VSGVRTARELARSATRSFPPITRTDIVKYAGAGGDFNPVHHDDDYARAHGYPAAFAMGLLAAGYLATFLEGWLGREHVRAYTVRFVEPVQLGDVLSCTGELAEEGPDGVRAELDVRDEQGGVKILGSAVLVAPPHGGRR